MKEKLKLISWIDFCNKPDLSCGSLWCGLLQIFSLNRTKSIKLPGRKTSQINSSASSSCAHAISVHLLVHLFIFALFLHISPLYVISNPVHLLWSSFISHIATKLTHPFWKGFHSTQGKKSAKESCSREGWEGILIEFNKSETCCGKKKYRKRWSKTHISENLFQTWNEAHQGSPDPICHKFSIKYLGSGKREVHLRSNYNFTGTRLLSTSSETLLGLIA